MSCSNCFNGCTEITSDKCVKYTGANIPALGIQNGDTLEFVEQALAQFLISALDGSGIKPPIDPSIICNAVSVNLPTCGDFTITDLISGLIKSVCDLKDLITDVSNNLGILEGPYDEGCLTVDETTFSNTHNVLQAVISQLCTLQDDFDQLLFDLPNTYVLTSELTNSVVAILENEGLIGPGTKQYTKMVPYTVIPWFAPSIAGLFDGTGKGLSTGEYENIYLCNGLNNTPDMRGRVPAGLTNGGMLGLTMDTEVAPSLANPLIPTYALGTRYGDNFVTLEIPQMPSHSHTATSVDAGHTHGLNGDLMDYNVPSSINVRLGTQDASVQIITRNTSESSQADITTTLTLEGENQAHKNTQPTIGCYYIMYIPAP
jgi:microcystin-dependent protein